MQKILLIFLASSGLLSARTARGQLYTPDQLKTVFGKEIEQKTGDDPQEITFVYRINLPSEAGHILVSSKAVKGLCRQVVMTKFNGSDAPADFTDKEMRDYMETYSKGNLPMTMGTWEQISKGKWGLNDSNAPGLPMLSDPAKAPSYSLFADGSLGHTLTLSMPGRSGSATKEETPAKSSAGERTGSKTLAGWKLYFAKDAKISSMINEFGKPDDMRPDGGTKTYLWYNALDYGANKDGILRVRVGSYQGQLIVISVRDEYNDLTATMPWAQKVLGSGDYGLPNE